MLVQQVGKKSVKIDWDKGEYPIIFRDFGGQGDMWTPPGKHSFCLTLTEQEMQPFVDLGFTGFKELKKRDPEDPNEVTKYRLKVKVNINGKYPPDIYFIKKSKKTKLDEETIGMLDRARISEGEMVITVSEWTFNMSKGVHLILNNGTYVIEDSNFTGKYDNIPMTGDVSSVTTKNDYSDTLDEDIPF